MPSDAPKALHQLGQSLWLDNITRDLLDSGTLEGYIDRMSVTGLTSNPTIFDRAISGSASYDAEIHRQLDAGHSGEALFFNLAIQDLTRAADLFAPVHQRTGTVDGFVSLEVSPLLAYDTRGDARAGEGAARPGGQAQPLHQDPRDHRRPAGDRGGDLRGRARERHPAVLDRRSICRRRCLSEGPGAARGGRPVGGRALGRLAVHQPVGPRRDRAAPSRDAQHAGPRGRQAGLQGLPRPAAERPVPAPGQCRRAAAAAAVREHRHEGQDARRTRSTSPVSRRPTRSTRCRRTRCSPSPIMGPP